jgi:hypothetical protein
MFEIENKLERLPESGLPQPKLLQYTCQNRRHEIPSLQISSTTGIVKM